MLCVLGRGGGDDGVRNDSKDGEVGRRLRDLVIQRIDHPSDDVSQLYIYVYSYAHDVYM